MIEIFRMSGEQVRAVSVKGLFSTQNKRHSLLIYSACLRGQSS